MRISVAVVSNNYIPNSVLCSTIQHCNLWMKKQMTTLTINQKRKTNAVITTAVILLLCFVTISDVNAQTFSPPQIPNYNAPSNNDPANGITVPSEPSNPGAPKEQPTVAPTPTPQTDYTPIAIAIIIVAIIAAAIIALTVNQKRKSSLPPPPPN